MNFEKKAERILWCDYDGLKIAAPVARKLTKAIASAFEETHNEALEEAVKVVTEMCYSEEHYEHICDEIAAAIRALKEKP